MTTTTSLSMNDGTTFVDLEEFKKIIGSLQYLLITHLDISFAVNKLAQHMHKPSSMHLLALKRVLRYLKEIMEKGIRISRSKVIKLTVFTDFDWAEDRDDRTSTSAFIIYLWRTPISWSSKKQKTVARSSTEVEYREIALVVSKLCLIQSLLHELRLKVAHKPLLLCDTLSVTYTCANLVFHTRMKHLTLIFFL